MIRRNSHFFMPLSKINFMPHCFLSQLKAALNEAQKNASLLAEYHELYELQRRRLESQVFMLTEERELWSTAAYSLAMKVRVTNLSVCWQSTTSCMSYRDSLIFVPWLNSTNMPLLIVSPCEKDTANSKSSDKSAHLRRLTRSSLFTCITYGTRGSFIQRVTSLTLLRGWAWISPYARH